MSHDNSTTATSPSPATEEERVGAIMASLPPTGAQVPTSESDGDADSHNASILAVRGLRTTATGRELYIYADIALNNHEMGGISLMNFEPFYFFFYGTLQIPRVLDNICELGGRRNVAMVNNATVDGWKLRMWGPYPTLVPAVNDGVKKPVKGKAWRCEKPEYVARLCTYETSSYRMAYCDVTVPSADGNDVEVIKNARVFVSNLAPEEMSDCEEFDVGAYERAISRPLF